MITLRVNGISSFAPFAVLTLKNQLSQIDPNQLKSPLFCLENDPFCPGLPPKSETG
jgi:hypothetical protein